MDSSEGVVDGGFRQSRLAKFGQMLALVSFGYGGLVLFTSLYVRDMAVNRASLPLVVAALAFGALWLLLRGAPRSPGVVRVEGASLDEIVEIDGAQPEERVIHILERAAASLAEAHDAGLVHRDVKPANILLVDRGGIADLVKVVDFGLVKDVGSKASGKPCQIPRTTCG